MQVGVSAVTYLTLGLRVVTSLGRLSRHKGVTLAKLESCTHHN